MSKFRTLTVTMLYDKGKRNGNCCYQFVVTDSNSDIVMCKNRWLATMVVEMEEIADRYNVSAIYSKFGVEYKPD